MTDNLKIRGNRALAAHYRQLAEMAKTEVARQDLLAVAAAYEALADKLEQLVIKCLWRTRGVSDSSST